MNFGFSEEQGEFREMLVRFFEEKSPITEVFRLQQTAEGNDPAVWKQMAEELGLQGIHLPVESGGQGFGFLELGIVMEEMGRNLVCSPYFSTVCLAANAILNAGTLEQKQRWLPGIASGGIIATLALLETGDIWNADGVRLSFETDGNSYRLSGTKRLVTDAASADLLVVAARQPGTTGEDGITFFVVRGDAEGLRANALEPLDLTRKLADVEMHDVAAELLGAEGSSGPALAKTLDQARICLALESAAGAERFLKHARRHGKQRFQFVMPLAACQAM